MNHYKDDANSSLAFAQIIPQLKKYISSSEGVTTQDMKKQFPEEYVVIKPKLTYMAKAGILTTTKKGSANVYSLTKEN